MFYRCDITPTPKAKDYLSQILDYTVNQTTKKNLIRNDQACVLVLA